MSSPIFHSIRFNLLLLPAVLSVVLVSFFWFKTVPSDASSSPVAMLPAALCAQPRSTIDLVLPPIDFVPTLSAEKFIGSKFQFEVAFDNNLGANTGFGPYLDVIFPASGIDGLPALDGIALDQSTGSGAEHLGVAIPSGDVIKQVFPATGALTHPFTFQTINGTAGDELVTITLPYASYTKPQLPARVLINAIVSNLADLNDPLIIKTRAGFRYGCAGSPAPVPSVPNPYDSGTITPILFHVEKKYDGPEIGPKLGETATGPNFPRHYTIDVYIAPGQQITNLKVTDLLPDNLAFVGLTSFSGGAQGPLPPIGVAASGSLLTISFPNITGAGLLTPDITIVFEFFIPLNNGSGAPILNPNTGASAISENNVIVEGDWSPVDQGDPSGPQILDPPGPEYTLVCKSIALQKRAINLTKTSANVAVPATDNAPRDFILNTVDFQVSDYFTFNQLTIEDVLSDGQMVVVFPPPPPSYSITDQLHTGSANTSTGFTLLPCAGFQAGMRRALFTLPGSMTGGAALATPSTVPATGQLTFRTRITESYVCVPPSGDKSVDQNDKLFNRATIKGTILNNSTLQPIGPMQDDHELQYGLLIGLLTKSVYAHRNRLGASPVLNPPPSTLFAPGDEITFRLKYQLPHGDIEKFSVEDFLPLSLLSASQLTTTTLASCGSGIPPAGAACFGPGNGVNISGLPLVGVNAGNNTLKLDYLTFDDPSSPPVPGKAVDILFTLTIQNNPYMDGQFVINQSLSSESNSFNQTVTQMAGAPFRVAEPRLRIRKGIVATTNTPASFNPTLSAPIGVPITSAMLATNSTAIQSNLGNADAGDLVTFAVVVENIGSSPYGAFDVKIKDTLPTGFAVPASLTVTDGNGLAIPFTGTVPNFFTPAGIELIDPPFNATTPHGALAGPGASGKNIAVIKYTLQVPSFAPCTNHSNTATITNYSSTEPAGPNYAFIGSPYGGPFINTRTLSIAGPRIQKIMGPLTTGTNVSAGQFVTYNVLVNLPEGSTPSVTVTDLPANMMVTSVGPVNSPNYSVTSSPTISPTLPATCGVPVTINFGGPINVPVNNVSTDNWFRFQVKTRVCSGLTTGQAGNSATVSAGASCQSSTSALQLTIVP